VAYKTPKPSRTAPNFTGTDFDSAIAAFRGAGEGASRFVDDMNTRIEREDKLRTNEAIASKLRGEEIPFDRRVDVSAVQEAGQSKGTYEANLETALTNQDYNRAAAGSARASTANTKVETELNELKLENEPKRFTKAMAEISANIKRYEQETDAALEAGKTSKALRLAAQTEAAQALKREELNRQFERVAEEEITAVENEEKTHIPGLMAKWDKDNPGATTEARATRQRDYEDNARATGEARFNSRAIEKLRKFAVDNDILVSDLDRTSFAQDEEAMREAIRTVTAERQAREAGEEKELVGQHTGAQQGNLENVIWTGTGEYNMKIGTKAEAGNNIVGTSANKVREWLNQRLNIEVEEEEVAAAKRVLDKAGGNESFFDQAMDAAVLPGDDWHWSIFWGEDKDRINWEAAEKEATDLTDIAGEFINNWRPPSHSEGSKPSSSNSELAEKARQDIIDSQNAEKERKKAEEEKRLEDLEAAKTPEGRLKTSLIEVDAELTALKDSGTLSLSEERKLDALYAAANEGIPLPGSNINSNNSYASTRRRRGGSAAARRRNSLNFDEKERAAEALRLALVEHR